MKDNIYRFIGLLVKNFLPSSGGKELKSQNRHGLHSCLLARQAFCVQWFVAIWVSAVIVKSLHLPVTVLLHVLKAELTFKMESITPIAFP